MAENRVKQAPNLIRLTMRSVGFHAVVPVALLAAMLFVVPEFTEFFEWFGPETPKLTQFVLAVSGFARDYFPVAVIVLMAFLTVDALIVYRLRATGDPILYRLWGLAVGLVEVAVLFTFIYALFAPTGVIMTTVPDAAQGGR